MIRTGLVRWSVYASRVPQRDRRMRYEICLEPQAEQYTILTGPCHSPVRKTVSLTPIQVREWLSPEDATRPSVEAKLTRRLARELAIEAVSECVVSGIISLVCPDRSLIYYLVETAIFRAIQNGGDPRVPREKSISLVEDMIEIIEQRVQATRRAPEDHRSAEEVEKARKKSFDLLREYLTPDECVEAKEKGQITIKVGGGYMIVPLLGHGLVDQYSSEGKYLASYCIIFQDYTIPLGDEILMKVILLKTDAERFFKIAIRFSKARVNRYTQLHRMA